MRDALDVVMAWQLRNPGTASTEGAVEEVKNTKMHGELTASLITHFLRLTIRPLFLKNQHQAVTAQGRKVTTTVLPKKLSQELPDDIAKPWKGKDDYALDILRWSFASLDDKAVERNWHLLLPPLLSILDDTEVKYKTVGCQLASLLLQRTPPSLLTRTGLSEVFEEALMPCLGYLPSLTPEIESAALLSAAYPALISLSRAMQDPKRANPQDRASLSMQIKLLDTMVRKGVLAGFSHCGENVKITTVLLQNLSLITQELGVETVKHLKHILPMLSDVLGNALGFTHPSTLLAASKSLQCVITSAWPRMAFNKGEVLKGLSLCWIHMSGEHNHDLGKVRKELKKTVFMLKDAIGSTTDIQADFDMLKGADSRLVGLFESSV